MNRPASKTLLHLPWEFDMLGGVDVVVDRLWHGLEEIRPESTLIGIQDWRRPRTESDASGRRFLRINFPVPTTTSHLKAARSLITLARRLPILLRQLQIHNITVVNFHFPTMCAYPLALLKRLGLWKGRMILSFHGSDVIAVDSKSNAWKLIANETDAVTTCSNALAERVRSLDLFAPQQITVIHNGIDVDSFRSNRAENYLQLPDSYLLSVGSYVPRKGQDILIKAFEKISDRFSSLHLVCAGGIDNGSWLAHIQKEVANSDLSSRIHLLENLTQNQVSELMRRATCLVHPARDEPFGLVIIEAGAVGLPVVASNVGGIREIITSESQGLIVEPGDSTALASAITKLLENRHLAESMGELLKTRVKESFSHKSMCARYNQVLL